ncbi:NAD(P)H-dependent oxidoreductase [Streptomyces sp. NPDC055058]
MPALLKGWIDRDFVNGWAFDYSPASGLQPNRRLLRQPARRHCVHPRVRAGFHRGHNAECRPGSADHQ